VLHEAFDGIFNARFLNKKVEQNKKRKKCGKNKKRKKRFLHLCCSCFVEFIRTSVA